MLSEEQESYVDDYYYSCLSELTYGTSREVLISMLLQFEEDEDYLACAGIKKGLEFYDMQVLTQKIVETNNQEDEQL